MAFTGNFMATSFKVELLQSVHNFSNVNPARSATTADVFKLALYTSAATLDATTTVYSATNEVAASGSYSAGGGALNTTAGVATQPTFGGSGTTAYLSFADLSFTTATITARGALIYNSSQSNKAVVILDFGSDKTSTAGTFTIQFPTANNTSAIIRIA